MGRVEVVLPNGTRCDCVTSNHAIEFDSGRGWAEAIGQSAYYSIHTKKKAGVVLILEYMGLWGRNKIECRQLRHERKNKAVV